MERKNNTFLNVRCCICGDIDKRYDSYYVSFKLSGLLTHMRYDLCGKCWQKLAISRLLDAINSEIRKANKKPRDANETEL